MKYFVNQSQTSAKAAKRYAQGYEHSKHLNQITMNKKISRILLAFLMLPIFIFSQKTIDMPYIETNSHVQSTIIKSIELSNDYTVVNIRYDNVLNYEWIQTYKPGGKKAFHITDQYGKRIAELISVKNIPFAPNKHKFRSRNEIVDFTLIFSPIENGLKKIDIIEGVAENGFNFYGVYIDGKVSKEETPGKNDIVKERVQVGSGTGFILNTDGFIATNFHVIQDAKDIEVVFPSKDGMKTYRVNVFLSDKTNDIAILKIVDSTFKKITYLPYELSDDYEVGEEVFTIGYPQPEIMGTESKLTTGIINSLSGIDNDNTCMQISVPIQPGNSGGPLFNSKGNIVGITTSSLNSIFMVKYKGNIPQNVNYAVKTEYLKVLTKSIRLDGKNIVKEMVLKDKTKIIKNYICLVKTF